MQRTLKRELKVLEIVKREAIAGSTCLPVTHPAWRSPLPCPEWSLVAIWRGSGADGPEHFTGGRASISGSGGTMVRRR